MEPDLCSSAPMPTCTGPTRADHVGIEELRKEKGSPTWRCSVWEVGEMGGVAAAGPCARFHGRRGRGDELGRCFLFLFGAFGTSIFNLSVAEKSN
jgi:hypothetical protein